MGDNGIPNHGLAAGGGSSAAPELWDQEWEVNSAGGASVLLPHLQRFWAGNS